MSGTSLPQTLKDKVAIITGASRGLGAEIALQLAQRGAKASISTHQILDKS
jgi:3-oxoacyl-[acyl-carrier protein] reductase